jgi:hypothetical protein
MELRPVSQRWLASYVVAGDEPISAASTQYPGWKMVAFLCCSHINYVHVTWTFKKMDDKGIFESALEAIAPVMQFEVNRSGILGGCLV